MRACLLAALGAVLLVGCIEQPATSHISKPVIGGEITPEGEFPGVGALWLSSQNTFECTGTLIAPDVVLTAAHCIVFAGETPDFTFNHDTVSSLPAVLQVTSAIAHENFDIGTDPGSGPGVWYDIALMFLQSPVTNVAPVKLPSAAEAGTLATGSQLALVGYGVTVDGGSMAGVMYDAVTDLVTVGNAELQISTPGAPQNCFGDSGGPALYDVGGEYRVVGVVSRDASGTGHCTGGGIDTRVDYYYDWIHAHAPQVCIPDTDCTATTPDAAPPPPDAEVTTPDAATGPDASGPGEEGDGGGCCSTGGGGSGPAGTALLALAVGAVIARRRRRD